MDSTTLLLSPLDEHNSSTKRRQSTTTTSIELPCPRCESTNTKFCYYNNYNQSQPRHFCKACRRYWTQGGTLRPIPVGGGTRNNITKSAPVKRQRRNEPAENKVSEPVDVSDVSVGPVVDLNEAWWSGLTTDGLFGPDVGYGLGGLDWGVEKSGDECGIVSWPENVLTPANELN